MRPFLRCLPLIALLAAPLQVYGGTTASMQVSFTILASCTVDARGAAAPRVNCMQADGFIVTQRATAPDNIVSGNDGAGWTVYF